MQVCASCEHINVIIAAKLLVERSYIVVLLVFLQFKEFELYWGTVFSTTRRGELEKAVYALLPKSCTPRQLFNNICISENCDHGCKSGSIYTS